MRNYLPKTFKYFLLALPLAEVMVFIIVSKWIGMLAVVLLIIFSTFLGFSVLRIQGFINLVTMQRRINAGEHPAINVLDSTLMMFGGLLLVIPGFITDIIGLFLLVRQVRFLILRCLSAAGILVPNPIESEILFGQGLTIEGEFEKEEK